eukprot:13453175-Alexandrium_andersonii.AAC.1
MTINDVLQKAGLGAAALQSLPAAPSASAGPGLAAPSVPLVASRASEAPSGEDAGGDDVHSKDEADEEEDDEEEEETRFGRASGGMDGAPAASARGRGRRCLLYTSPSPRD